MRSLGRWLSWGTLCAIAAAPAAGCGGGGGGGGGHRLSVLVVQSIDTFTADVVAKLEDQHVFASVTSFDSSAGTPTLGELLTFDVVLCLTDNVPDDTAALGDVLADYVDAGHGLVLGMFCFEAGLTLDGRFEADDFYAIPEGGDSAADDGPLGIDPVIPGHPILSGVHTFSGGTSSFRPDTAAINPAATVVARWDDADGTPLVATRIIGNTRRADLGFYPPTTDTGRDDFVDPSTDAMLLLANALRWVGRDL